jgi:hypothetical protein
VGISTGPAWDRRTPRQQARFQDAALRRQVADSLGPFSPYWRTVLRNAGIRVAQIDGRRALAGIPATGERDLCPAGDPAAAAALVLQLDEAGWATHTDGAALRRALGRRVVRPGAYRRQVMNAVRPVVYWLGGRHLDLPIASTRDDLDVVARAGARAWRVLGLTPEDLLVSALPQDGRLAAAVLPYVALGAGAPAVHAGPAGAVAALRALPAAVVAVDGAPALRALGRLPARVHTILTIGLDDLRPIADGRTVLRLWGPPDGRWLYPECRDGGFDAGLHTFPDLEIGQTVDPATGEARPDDAAGELVVTQLGVRGSALVRWRTGVLHGGIRLEPCPGCGRTVPRLGPDLDTTSLTPTVQVAEQRVSLDLRTVAGALAARSDLAGWQVRLVPDPRGGRPSAVVAVAPGTDGAMSTRAASTLCAQIAYDVQALAGAAPSLVVLAPELAGQPPRIVAR